VTPGAAGAPGIRILAQRQAVDARTFDELASTECVALGVALDIAWTDDLSGLATAVDDAAAAGEPLVVVPAPRSPDLGELTGLGDAEVLRLDIHVREPDRSPGLAAHLQGRGLWGLVWALRAVHYRRRHAPQVVPYGEAPDQFGELRLPREGSGPFPVITLLHGGFWRSCWQLDLMDALSIDLAERGFATWNLEYRRPDRHGWDATVADVRTGLRHLEELRQRWPLDLARVGLVGHSAGGSLAVQAGAEVASRSGPETELRIGLVVQLAGLVDLVGTHRRDIGNGAVPLALGGTPEQVPDVYASASPLEGVPSGVTQLVVVGTSDSVDLLEMSRRYVRAARAANDDVELLEDDGDLFAVIDPASAIWQRTAKVLSDTLGV
jgi:acetyl esterase/lipase